LQTSLGDSNTHLMKVYFKLGSSNMQMGVMFWSRELTMCIMKVCFCFRGSHVHIGTWFRSKELTNVHAWVFYFGLKCSNGFELWKLKCFDLLINTFKSFYIFFLKNISYKFWIYWSKKIGYIFNHYIRFQIYSHVCMIYYWCCYISKSKIFNMSLNYHFEIWNI
jgi:hypothetical protein